MKQNLSLLRKIASDDTLFKCVYVFSEKNSTHSEKSFTERFSLKKILTHDSRRTRQAFVFIFRGHCVGHRQ